MIKLGVKMVEVEWVRGIDSHFRCSPPPLKFTTYFKAPNNIWKQKFWVNLFYKKSRDARSLLSKSGGIYLGGVCTWIGKTPFSLREIFKWACLEEKVQAFWESQTKKERRLGVSEMAVESGKLRLGATSKPNCWLTGGSRRLPLFWTIETGQNHGFWSRPSHKLLPMQIVKIFAATCLYVPAGTRSSNVMKSASWSNS